MSPDEFYALDPLLRLTLSVGVAGVFTTILYAAEAWWSSPARREPRLRKWAGRHVASYDDEWLVPFQRQNLSTRRIAAVCGFVGLVITFELPLGGQLYAALLFYSVPAVVAIVYGVSATRVALRPGTRVARLRELETADYLPGRLRLFMWVAGACGCLACLLVGVVASQWWLAASGLLMVVAPASVELAARRLARMPEPAQNAAHLYLQDVMRAEHIRWAALSAALSAAMACNGLFTAVDQPDWLFAVLAGANLALLTGLFWVALSPDLSAPTYMRSRLWPQLRSGQVLEPGDPLPGSGGVA